MNRTDEKYAAFAEKLRVEKDFKFQEVATKPITLEEKAISLCNEVMEYRKLMSDAKKIKEKLENQVRDLMFLNGKELLEAGSYRIHFHEGVTRKILNTEALKKHMPEVYEAFLTESEPTDKLDIRLVKTS